MIRTFDEYVKRIKDKNISDLNSYLDFIQESENQVINNMERLEIFESLVSSKYKDNIEKLKKEYKKHKFTEFQLGYLIGSVDTYLRIVDFIIGGGKHVNRQV